MVSRPQSLQGWLQVGLILCLSLTALGSVRAAEVPESDVNAEECADRAAAPTAETLLKRFEVLEGLKRMSNEIYDRFPERYIEGYGLGKYKARLIKFEVEMEMILERIFATPLGPKVAKDIRSLEYELRRTYDDLLIWAKRTELLPFEEIIEEPLLLMPGRVYLIDSERGDRYKVRFSRPLVEQFYWEYRDTGRVQAAHQSLVGVHRGLRPATSSAAGGIEFYKEVDGVQIVKIQIVGRQTGAYRVYGCLKNGIFEFVLWEHEGNHDARYLSRVSHHTADLCKAL